MTLQARPTSYDESLQLSLIQDMLEPPSPSTSDDKCNDKCIMSLAAIHALKRTGAQAR